MRGRNLFDRIFELSEVARAVETEEGVDAVQLALPVRALLREDDRAAGHRDRLRHDGPVNAARTGRTNGAPPATLIVSRRISSGRQPPLKT